MDHQYVEPPPAHTHSRVNHAHTYTLLAWADEPNSISESHHIEALDHHDLIWAWSPEIQNS